MKLMKTVIVLAALVCADAARAEHSNRPDLSGIVLDETGSPVTNATVFIHTAGPKAGAGVICPSCYADCEKRAKSDADGAFLIADLDPELFFKLLVAAPGFETRFVSKVDPAAGPQEIRLKPISPGKLKSARRIAGVVLGPNGETVPGAIIIPEGVRRGESTRWGGTEEFVDAVAVADERGRFLLFCQPEVDAVEGVAKGPNTAPRWVELKPGLDHLVRLSGGAFVSGRIEANGKPVSGAVVGASTVERQCGKYLNLDTVATDEEGKFGLSNVPRGKEFVAFVKMSSLNGLGAAPQKTFTVPADGETLNLGTLDVPPGHRVAGQIVLSDGRPIPANTRLMLGIARVIDVSEVVLPPDGRFEFKGVPAESVRLHLRLKGYKFSKKNPSLDWLNGGIVGRVDRDVHDLTLLMDPGEWRHEDRGELPPGTDSQPEDQPLRGVKL